MKTWTDTEIANLVNVTTSGITWNTEVRADILGRAYINFWAEYKGNTVRTKLYSNLFSHSIIDPDIIRDVLHDMRGYNARNRRVALAIAEAIDGVTARFIVDRVADGTADSRVLKYDYITEAVMHIVVMHY